MSERIPDFSSFWLYYIGEHRNPLCRATHFVGTTGFVSVVGWCIIERPLRMTIALALGLLVGFLARKVEARRRAVPELLALGIIWAVGHPLVYAGILVAYFFAWVGHYLIEHNRPATFSYPLWSLAGDFKMYGQMLTGRLWSGDASHIAPIEA
jgi:hypothetical protein